MKAADEPTAAQWPQYASDPSGSLPDFRTGDRECGQMGFGGRLLAIKS